MFRRSSKIADLRCPHCNAVQPMMAAWFTFRPMVGMRLNKFFICVACPRKLVLMRKVHWLTATLYFALFGLLSLVLFWSVFVGVLLWLDGMGWITVLIAACIVIAWLFVSLPISAVLFRKSFRLRFFDPERDG